MPSDADFYASPPALRRSASSSSTVSWASSPTTPRTDCSTGYHSQKQSFTEALYESDYENHPSSSSIAPNLLSFGMNQHHQAQHPAFQSSSPQQQRSDSYVLQSVENTSFSLRKSNPYEHSASFSNIASPASAAHCKQYFTQSSSEPQQHNAHLEHDDFHDPSVFDLHLQYLSDQSEDLENQNYGGYHTSRSAPNPHSASLTALECIMPSSPATRTPPTRRRRPTALAHHDDKVKINYPCIVNNHENPFACPVPSCERRFKRQEHLKRHDRVHTKEKPYKCEACGRPFSRTDNLKQHRRTHAKQTGRNPYVPGLQV